MRGFGGQRNKGSTHRNILTFEYFRSMSALILARLEFLHQTLMFLILEEDLSWQVIIMAVHDVVRGAVLRGGSVRRPEQSRWGDAEGMVRPPTHRVVRLRALAAESVKLVVLGKVRSLAREFSGSMNAAGRRWRRAVQERRTVRRAVQRGERRAVRSELEQERCWSWR
jgi:hypothetical protein